MDLSQSFKILELVIGKKSINIIHKMGVHKSCCQEQTKGAQFPTAKYQTNKQQGAKARGKKELSSVSDNALKHKESNNEDHMFNPLKQQQQSTSILLKKALDQQNLVPLPDKLSSINEGESSEVQQYQADKQQNENPIQVPQLTDQIKTTIKNNYFYENQLHSDLQYRKYGQDVYYGRLDQKKQLPHGFGKLYKNDKSFYMGQFMNGKAQGRGVFIFADGSFYSGYFHKDCAQSSNAQYKSSQFQYIGAFKQNLFHYRGKEKGLNYTFVGQYEKGHRTFGKLEWVHQTKNYSYQGQFNQNNQFHGNGILTEPTGTYHGSFLNGKQEGVGTYKFANHFRYEGDYREGERSGRGVIWNQNNQIVFRGQMLKGMPHGVGQAVNTFGKVRVVVWEDEAPIDIV